MSTAPVETSSKGPKDDIASSKEKWMDKIESLQVPRSEVNKLIMNYLVTEGFKDAAEKFQIESGTEPGVDLKTLDKRIKILEKIQEGEIQKAIHMINAYQPQLLDDNRYLYFHLQQQHLIELIRAKNIDAALKFAQENLADQGEENTEVLEELERTLALLAFEDAEISPFGDLLALSHRQKVASELNTAFLGQENKDSSVSKLAYLLKFVLWAQEELDRKKVKYPKMTDLAIALIEEPNK
ncbi:glucose-induced degradation protein 8 homolog [Folsomia candida]|uniref:glucose-induced degradation protein 8 homolog n=1 Tax=Folsomia candida TaxID=158441 RepID=UPI000B8F02DC|nr:glucose-induced degradation protein 8 homolog [Folsomia candida]